MDYVFTITEFDADNVDSSFAVNHGRTDHKFNLTLKTYDTVRTADGIPPVTTFIVWNENIDLITSYITRETNRVYAQLLLDKNRLYELVHFGAYINVQPNDKQEAFDKMNETEATLAYLKNYKP
jgi:hypothetical protein